MEQREHENIIGRIVLIGGHEHLKLNGFNRSIEYKTPKKTIDHNRNEMEWSLVDRFLGAVKPEFEILQSRPTNDPKTGERVVFYIALQITPSMRREMRMDVNWIPRFIEK